MMTETVERVAALAAIANAARRWRDARRECLDRLGQIDIKAGETAAEEISRLGAAEGALLDALQDHLETAGV